MKPVEWVGSSYKDFRAFPDPVQDEMGFALYQAQIGGKSADTKLLKALVVRVSLRLWPTTKGTRIGPFILSGFRTLSMSFMRFRRNREEVSGCNQMTLN
jgi:hypothetical protein